MERNRWYKDKVFYQIWPRSFKDGNADGMGDLYGVYEKLDYIKSLGVDGIWFSPLYPSPGIDCGYDISDYMNIDEAYGGMEAFQKVLKGAHERDMKVLMDLVVNHTSDQHPWFQMSRKRIEPYTDYYIWRKGIKGKLPNNWDSNFEGKAWTWDEERGEYYLHLFAVQQPDLNMANPKVRDEVCNILKFWLDMGVDGFREDVITYISKPDDLPNDRILPVFRGILHYNHGPYIHQYLSEFRERVLSHYDCMTIAEAPLVSPKRALEYIEETDHNEMDMMIQFQCMCADCLFTDYFHTGFSLRRLKRAWTSWQEKLEGKAWNMLYLENHDHPRVISRYGSEKYWKESGKLLAGAYLFQKGTPFLYQGQEIGMLNWYPQDPLQYEDVQTRWQYFHVGTKKSPEKRLKRLWYGSRDSARTPVQWSNGDNAGFSECKPWFYVNENYQSINVELQEKDQDSILNFYRKAIELRKKSDAVRNGEYREYFKCSGKYYVYTRTSEKEKLLVLCSFMDKNGRFPIPRDIRLERCELLLCNYETVQKETARPYEIRVYRVNI